MGNSHSQLGVVFAISALAFAIMLCACSSANDVQSENSIALYLQRMGLASTMPTRENVMAHFGKPNEEGEDFTRYEGAEFWFDRNGNLSRIEVDSPDSCSPSQTSH